MTPTQSSPLVQAFLDDHQQMTRKLQEVIARLEQDEVQAACTAAEQLDRIAGPHIAFEESILYPAVGRAQGKPFQRQLLSEHAAMRAGLLQLLASSDAQLSKPAVRDEVLEQLQAGLRHAESCGTLISHLAAFTSEEQQAGLTKLKLLKQAGQKWSET